jgi:hypothetical protein
MTNPTKPFTEADWPGEKVPTSHLVAKLAGFFIPYTAISYALRQYPRFGNALGIILGMFCWYFIPPRRLTLLKSLLLGVGLSILYLLILWLWK